jgi:hypothetical protein
VTILEALRAVCGNPKLLAVLPPGPPEQPALITTPGMRIMDVRNGKPRTFQPKYSDLMSIQWEVIDMSVPRQPRERA